MQCRPLTVRPTNSIPTSISRSNNDVVNNAENSHAPDCSRAVWHFVNDCITTMHKLKCYERGQSQETLAERFIDQLFQFAFIKFPTNNILYFENQQYEFQLERNYGEIHYVCYESPKGLLEIDLIASISISDLRNAIETMFETAFDEGNPHPLAMFFPLPASSKIGLALADVILMNPQEFSDNINEQANQYFFKGYFFRFQPHLNILEWKLKR